MEKIIYTIGHSTRSIEEFISLLQENGIACLVDVRNFPGSKRFPHFNKEALEASLLSEKIRYLHVKDLGGRRKPLAESKNTRWKHAAFRGYADYMQTGAFQESIESLANIAGASATAYMCSEAVWWSCHRSLISDYLKIRGWKVMHIMSAGKLTEHPYTSAARIVGKQLRYDEPDLFTE
jgi:uncharacterized protein (DUF488 family)